MTTHDASLVSLFSALARDDADAWAALSVRLRPDLLRVATRYCRDGQLAEDVVQEALLAIADAAKRVYRRSPWSDADVLRYCKAIAVHKAISARRRGRKTEAWEAEDLGALEQCTTRPDDELIRKELAELLHACLSELQGPVAEAIALHHLGGLSCQQVADLQAVSNATVRMRIWRGLRKLRAGLRKHGVRASTMLILLAMRELRAETAVAAPTTFITSAVSKGTVFMTLSMSSLVCVCLPWLAISMLVAEEERDADAPARSVADVVEGQSAAAATTETMPEKEQAPLQRKVLLVEGNFRKRNAARRTFAMQGDLLSTAVNDADARRILASDPSVEFAQILVPGDVAMEAALREFLDRQRAYRMRQPYEPTINAELDGPLLGGNAQAFVPAWDVALKAPAHCSWVSPNAPDLLMVQLQSGEVQCLHIRHGQTLWISQALPERITLDPHVGMIVETNKDGVGTSKQLCLSIISGKELFCFDAAYGSLLLRQRLDFQASSPAYLMNTADGARVFVGSWDKHLYATAAFSGRPAQSWWQWKLPAVPTAQSSGADASVSVADCSGGVHCFGPQRERKWQYQSPSQAAIKGPMLLRGDHLFFGSSDHVLHVLDCRTGDEKGNLYLGADIRRRPFVCDNEPDNLYVWTSGVDGQAGLHKISVQSRYQADGSVKQVDLTRSWFFPGLTKVVASNHNHLYATRANSSVVVAIDRRSGKAAWHWNLNDGRAADAQLSHITAAAGSNDSSPCIVTVDAQGKLTVYRQF